MAAMGWLDHVGVRDEFVRVREHDADELSHYSSRTIDFEYNFPGAMGWKELYGLANRTDYDLRQHEYSAGRTSTISTRRRTATSPTSSNRRSGSTVPA